MMSILILLPILGLLVTGIVLVAFGVRGVPRFSEPRCAKCNYDLRGLNFQSAEPRRCSECGADLAAPRAVNFGRFERRPRRAIIGVAMIALALLLPFGLALGFRSVMGSRGPGNPTRSTKAILASLPTSANTPWDWQELDRRLKAGTLSQPEVDAAFTVVIADLQQKRAAGNSQEPLHWSNDFLRNAIASNRVSPATVQALCKAYYAPGPRVSLRSVARVGQDLQVEIDSDHHWNIDPLTLVWSLQGITAATAPSPKIVARHAEASAAANPDQFSGGSAGSCAATLKHDLPAGEHELVFTFDLGVVPQGSAFRGLNGNPGTADKWPSPVAQWQTTVKRKVRIVGKNDPVVTLLTDPADNPFKTSPLAVKEAMIRSATRGTQLVITWRDRPKYPVNVCYRMEAVAGGKSIPCGRFLQANTNRGGIMTSISDQADAPALPADVTTIDLIFTPDASAAEQYIDIDRIWGQPFEIKNVPVSRYDLPITTRPSP